MFKDLIYKRYAHRALCARTEFLKDGAFDPAAQISTLIGKIIGPSRFCSDQVLLQELVCFLWLISFLFLCLTLTRWPDLSRRRCALKSFPDSIRVNYAVTGERIRPEFKSVFTAV